MPASSFTEAVLPPNNSTGGDAAAPSSVSVPSLAAASPAGSGKLARNVFVTLAAQLVSWGVTLVVNLYLPRYIGAKGYGMWTLAQSFASIATIMAILGTSTVIVREVARDNAVLPREVAAGVAIRLVSGLLAVVIAFGVALAFHYEPLLLGVIAVNLIIMMLGQLTDVLTSALQGLERMPQQNAALLAGRVIVAAVQLYAVAHHLSLLVVIAAGIIGVIVTGAWALSSLLQFLRPLPMPTRESVTALLRAGMPFLSIAIFLGIYGSSDSILLSKLCSLPEVGWYGLGRTLIGSTLFIPSAVCSAMLPMLSRLFREDYEQFVATVARVMNLMLICVTPFIALLLFAPGQILAFLHYPKSFEHSIPVLMAMSGAGLLWYISQVAANALTASDRQAQLSRATSIGAAICLPTSIGCILLARHFLHNGAIGAAVSNGLVECVIFSGYLRALPKGIISWGSLSVVGRSILAALPLVAWLYFVHDRLWFMLGAVPAAAIYVALCWALKCFHASDTEMLRQVLRRKTAA